jgi:hypothetical protein
MDAKKWPVLAQILIGLGAIGELVNISAGVLNKSALGVIIGVVGFLLYWGFYKMQKWAYIGINILLSLGILLSLASTGRIPLVILIVAVVYPAFVLVYFNSPKIRGFFYQAALNEKTNLQ